MMTSIEELREKSKGDERISVAMGERRDI